MSFAIKSIVSLVFICIVSISLVGCGDGGNGSGHHDDHDSKYVGKGDETLNLGHYVVGTKTKPSVIFPHWKHQKHLNADCTLCHINHQPMDRTTGQPLDTNIQAGDASNKFHTNLCWQCHDARGISKVGSGGNNCDKCHSGSK